MELASFTFNPFQENTYVLSDDTRACIIIDPGMMTEQEEKLILDYIESSNLIPEKLINTHCHIDHVLGNKFIADSFNLKLHAHAGERPVLEAGPQVSHMYQIPYKTSPEIEIELDLEKPLVFGNTSLKMLFTPGHSPASVSFLHEESKILIAGDVLFQGSIGRTDLPGGDYATLINSIKTQFMVLDDEVRVYSGHGPSTTIGEERRSNPFLN